MSCIFLSIKLLYLRLSFVIQAKAFDKSFKGAKCVSITITTTRSNINEVIMVILNSFIQTSYNRKKAQHVYKQINIKDVSKKHLSSNVNEVKIIIV